MNFKEESNEQELITVASAAEAVELTAEYVLSQIVKLFNMLNNTNAPKGKRDSIRGIWATLTSIAMPKAVGTQLRHELEELGFVGGANGSIATFKDLEHYPCLIQYARFSEDSYTVPQLNEANLSSVELKIYKKAIEMQASLPQELSEWAKRLESLGLREPDLGLKGEYIQIVGEAFEDLEERIIDIPEVTKHLPEGARLIRYYNSAYLYVTTPCMLELTWKNLPLMGIDITPVFYQTFEGGKSIESKSYPPCEDLPEGAYFESFPEQEMALAITTVKAYIALIKKGIYQRYNVLEEWHDYKFHINYYFLPHIIDSPTIEEITEALESYILPVLCTFKDIEFLEFIKKDLPDVLSVQGEEIIISALDKRISELRT